MKIPLDRNMDRPKGFAFVAFENPKDADAALEALNNYDLFGRPLRVLKSTPRGEGGNRSK